jgi:hypothetical protein
MEGAAGEALKRTLQALLYTFVLTLFLGAGWGIAEYYREQFAYNLSGNRFDSREIILGLGLKRAFTLMTAYIIYAGLREAAIRFLETDHPGRTFRVSIANQVSGFLVIYLSFGYFLFAFNIQTGDGFYIFYFGVIGSVLMHLLCQLYWLLPLKGEISLFKKKIIWRWLLSTLICSIPVGVAFFWDEPKVAVPAALLCWVLLLLVNTPVSWLIYRQRKDKILQLRGLESALGKSEADLQFLRSQINPHFLFNALNTLAHRCRRVRVVRPKASRNWAI